jgi:hypothetical protein
MATDINTIDFGRDSHKASTYNDSRDALLRALNEDQVTVSSQEDTSADAAIPSSEPKASQETGNDTLTALKMLGFTPGKEVVEFIFKLADENSAVRIKMQSMSVAHNEDSISILIPSTIELHPPKLTEFAIKLNGIQYPVIYAGSVLKLGSIQMLSFVRTQ